MQNGHRKIVLFIVCLFIYPALVASSELTDLSEQEKQIYRLINIQRQHHQLKPLSPDKRLYRAAQAHSQDMQKNDYFSHYALNGNTAVHRALEQGYELNHVVENLARGLPDAHFIMYGTMDLSEISAFDKKLGNNGFENWDDIGKKWNDENWDAWFKASKYGGLMGSAGHRKNILDNSVTDVGIAFSQADKKGYVKLTQVFASGDSQQAAPERAIEKQ